MKHLLEVLVEALVLRDDQVVLKDSLDEVLAREKILKLLEVNGILGGLHL
jgi:archaellum biogenesis ATPase FlaH